VPRFGRGFFVDNRPSFVAVGNPVPAATDRSPEWSKTLMLKCGVALMLMLTIAPSVLAQAAKDALAIENARAPAVTDTRTVNLPVYMTIRNRGDKDERLVAATTPYADRVELIELRNEIGINLPMAADVLLVAPGTSLDLNPLGPRLLLSGLKTPLEAADRFPITLVFEQSGAIEIEVLVEAGATGQAHRH
jgi:periplasmic copper chaperone A